MKILQWLDAGSIIGSIYGEGFTLNLDLIEPDPTRFPTLSLENDITNLLNQIPAESRDLSPEVNATASANATSCPHQNPVSLASSSIKFYTDISHF